MSIRSMAWTWKLHLPASTKLILLALADHSDDEGFCWPGIVGIAEKCNLSDRSVQRHIQNLITRGLLRVQERFRPDGSRASNLYHLQVSWGGDTVDRGVVTQSHQVVMRVSPLESSRNHQKETSGESSRETSHVRVISDALSLGRLGTKIPTREGALCAKLSELGVRAAPYMLVVQEMCARHSDEHILAATEIALEKKGSGIHIGYIAAMLKDPGKSSGESVKQKHTDDPSNRSRLPRHAVGQSNLIRL